LGIKNCSAISSSCGGAKPVKFKQEPHTNSDIDIDAFLDEQCHPEYFSKAGDGHDVILFNNRFTFLKHIGSQSYVETTHHFSTIYPTSIMDNTVTASDMARTQ
jgi:hypothetical protein